jgi:rare lipoprotein A
MDARTRIIGLIRPGFAVAMALAAACCHRPPPSNPHYVLGAPYQADGVWYYPRENYALQETGLAAVSPAGHADLTADGEAFDQAALAAAHQTLQLPAIARLTNLANGRQVVVRINDRGPATPHRLVEITRRTAVLLDVPTDDVARMQLQVLPTESYAAAEAAPGVPQLDIALAPLGAVQQSDLPPPGSGLAAQPTPATPAQPPVIAAATPDLQLPEVVTQTAPDPGNLFVQLGTFQNFQYADIQRARVGGLGAHIVSTSEGRAHTYRVMIGPLASVQQADTVLDQVLAAGVTDARIVVE